MALVGVEMMTQGLLCLLMTTSVFLSLKSSDQLPNKTLELAGELDAPPDHAGQALAKIPLPSYRHTSRWPHLVYTWGKNENINCYRYGTPTCMLE